jgi:uncharacterized protein YeaO (DUF488 family)
LLFIKKDIIILNKKEEKMIFLTPNKEKVILFHYIYFLHHYKSIFSQNFVAYMFSEITESAQSTIKKDLIKKDISKLIYRITNNPKKYKELKNEFKESLKTNKERFKDMKNLFQLEILISNNQNFDNDNKIIETLNKFLTLDEINGLKQKKFQKDNLITLKASYFNFKIYLELLYPEENINEFLKKYFQYLNEQEEKNWLKAFFNSKPFSDKTNDEQRHISNIIAQKNKLKFKTFKKYLNEEYKQFNYILIYAIYLYTDYLEMLKESLNIDQNILDKFIKSIN